MRNRIILATILLMSTLSMAHAEEIVKNERIQKVIVFRNGAQIESKVSQTLDKGEHLFIIENLPNTLQDNSVQVLGEGEFTILSVESKTGNVNTKKKSPALQAILDSIDTYKNLIEMDNIKKYAIDQEESLLITNKNISSKQSAQVVDIEDLAELYRRRLPELKKESFRLQKQITANTEKLNILNQQLAERQSGKNNKQIWVYVSLNQAQNVRLNLKYLVMDASWSPVYDIRTNDIGEDIQFILKANVTQSTGVNWENVELSLSTGNPTLYSSKPMLYDWRLSLSTYQPPVVMYDRIELSKSSAIQANLEVPNEPLAVTTEQVNNIQYNITKAFSINSDGDAKTIEIQRNTAKATYRYVAIPKLDNNAYLMASVKDWDQFLLQAAEANVFLKGAFVTKTNIDPMSINDSLEISLGNDESIKIERKLAKELTSKKVLGGTKKLMQGYEISVRNTKSKAINIEIYDQVPISTDKDIQVNFTALDASVNAETGQLSWKYSIAPAETKKMSFQLEVKYPKSKVLQGW